MLSLGLTMCQSHHARQYNGGMTTIKLEDAIGTRLARDITEIRPGEFKCPSTPMILKAFAGLPIDMLAGSAITDPQQTHKIVGHGGGTRVETLHAQGLPQCCIKIFEKLAKLFETYLI